MAHGTTRTNAVNNTFGLEIQDYLNNFTEKSDLGKELRRPDNTVVLGNQKPILTTTKSDNCLQSEYYDVKRGSSEPVILQLAGASKSSGQRYRLSGNVYGGLCTNNQKVLDAYKKNYGTEGRVQMGFSTIDPFPETPEAVKKMKGILIGKHKPLKKVDVLKTLKEFQDKANRLPKVEVIKLKNNNFDDVRKNADKAFDELDKEFPD
ncbi:MAG: hypothetical protein ACD_73C00208G0003 [uncultured bacterium]|nr:MAG: hypothetical protein ACD_73C00208G0003 [uncultured bacterium]